MPDMPTGTVTFLFSDIEGSTARWEQQQETMRVALARHDAILRQVIEEHGGFIFKTIGDAFCAAFATAADALAAALGAQRLLGAEPPSRAELLQVRMALHTGAAEERDSDYFGPPLNRVARLLATGHGAQTLLSLATAELVQDDLPPDVQLRDLGVHRLKDLTRPEHIFQLVALDLPTDFPPLKSLDSRPHNLPSQPTPLIGREREVAAVIERLQRPDVRLLILIGPGGTGKTRLALQVAAELLADFANGVFFVALAPIRDPALVASAITQALGIREIGNRPLIEGLAAYLHGKRLLLVIDNFEQVLPAASLLADMLAAAPLLKILVTSRAVLGAYGEHDFVVPPLLLPDSTHSLPVERLTQYEAVRLFIERAQAAQADFTVTSDNAPAVAEICSRLDGLPLAIELAAARIRLLPPQALLARLSQRLNVLTGGARTLPARQQTLRGTIDWSYELLDEDERLLFARLAVFVGGCTLAMAELVCNPAHSLPLDVFDGLQSLLDKSLLFQVMGVDDEPRFLMLETIREYALERLKESGEAEALRRAHAEQYLALVQQAQPQFFGADQNLWFGRMEAELDNLRAALMWSKAAAEGAQVGLQLAGLLWRFWAVRGHGTEGRKWLDELLSRRHGLPKSAIWYALHTAGNLADDQGDLAQAKLFWEECLSICRELGNKNFVGHMLNNLANLAVSQGAYDRAAALYEEALDMYRNVGNAWGIGMTTRNLGRVLHIRGDYQRARQLFEESLGLMRERGDSEAAATIIADLGKIAYDLADHKAARQHFDEAHRLLSEVASKPGLAFVLSYMGELARHEGDCTRASALLEHSLGLQRELGNKEGVAHALYHAGRVAYDQGNYRAARSCFSESLRIQQDIGNKQGIAVLLEAFAALAFAEQQTLLSAQLLSAATALRQSVSAPLTIQERAKYERLVMNLRDSLGQVSFGAAWLTWQSMPVEQAIMLAQASTQLEPRVSEP
jgi:predicted ATPase/class 3 adenylate cyclase